MFNLNIFTFVIKNLHPPTLYELIMFSLIFVGPGLLFWKGYWPFAVICWPIAFGIVSYVHWQRDLNNRDWYWACITCIFLTIAWAFVVVFVS
jgi:hypothetical protein